MRDSQRDLKADSRSWIMVESRLNHFYFDRPDSELSNLMKWIYSNLEHRESPQENRDSGAWISFRGDSVIQRWFTVPTIRQWIQPSWITSWITSWISRESLTLTVPIITIIYLNISDCFLCTIHSPSLSSLLVSKLSSIGRMVTETCQSWQPLQFSEWTFCRFSGQPMPPKRQATRR